MSCQPEPSQIAAAARDYLRAALDDLETRTLTFPVACQVDLLVWRAHLALTDLCKALLRDASEKGPGVRGA